MCHRILFSLVYLVAVTLALELGADARTLPVRAGIIGARLESIKSVYRVGEPIGLRLTLINKTGQKIFYVEGAPYEMSDIEVLNDQGRALSPTVPRGPCICKGSVHTIALYPGRPLVVDYNRHASGFTTEAYLNDWGFVLTRPGSYKVTVILALNAIGVKGPEFTTSPADRSNTLHITIIKRPS